jgi:phenylacetate-CoA ligase
MLNRLKNIYEHSPTPLKRLYASVPFEIRMGSAYRKTRNFLENSEQWSSDELTNYQNNQLKKLILHAYNNVPYYRRVFDEIGITPADICNINDLRKLPFLTRNDVKSHFDELRARNIYSWRTHLSTTGGTTGEPLGFFINNNAYAIEWAFMIDQWSRIGYDPSCRKMGLREFAYKTDSLFHYDPIYNEIRISSLDLSRENIEIIVGLSREFNVSFIHAFPSALTIYAQLLKRTGISMNGLTGILLGSEKLYDWQRELFHDVFGCRVFSWYGQTEKVILAGECEHSSYYHVYPQYGCTELVSEDGNVIDEPNVRGELVGTGFLNSAMPFIRYKTGDYAMYADYSCPCGRAYRLITSVEGRRSQDAFVGKDGQLITATAFSVSDWMAFSNVQAFQFEQEIPGQVMLNVLPSNHFSDEDALRIAALMKQWAGSSLEFRVSKVETLYQTPRGKIPFLVQKLVLSNLT